jgi:hypothetical protein
MTDTDKLSAIEARLGMTGSLREAVAEAIGLKMAGAPEHAKYYVKEADAAILALREWLEAEGLVVVPAKPSDKMWDDARGVMPNGQAYYSYSSDEIGELVFDVYDAMIAAAPDALDTKP